MSLDSRDKRALTLLGVAFAGAAIYLIASSSGGTVAAPTTRPQSIPAAEAKLASMRMSVARVPGKDEVLKQAQAELADREKGLIQADTANQAQEQLLQIVKSLAQLQAIDIRGQELGSPRPFGDSYGEVTVGVIFEARIEQLINMLADLTARPELVSTNDLRIGAANVRTKTINVRLTVSGIVPRKLVPERKGINL